MRIARQPEADLGRRSRRLAAMVPRRRAAGRGARSRAAVARTGVPARALAPALAASAGVALLARAGGADLPALAMLGAAILLAASWFRLRLSAPVVLRSRLARWWERRSRSRWPGSRSDSTPHRTSARSWEQAVRRSPIAPGWSSSRWRRWRRFRSRRRRRPRPTANGAPVACSASPSARSSSPARCAIAHRSRWRCSWIGGATAIFAVKSQRGAPSRRWLTALVLTCLIAAVSWEIPIAADCARAGLAI